MPAGQSRYSSFLERFLLPSYYGLRGRSYARHRRWLEQSQWWSADQLQDFQWRELQRLLRHAIETVPYYRQKYAACGVASAEDVRTREDFARLPTLTREEINQHRNDLCSTEFRGKLLAHSTTGSSGKPTHFFITYESYDWRTAVSSRAYSWSGARVGERTLYLWGGPVKAAPQFAARKLSAYRALRRELVFNTFAQSEALWRSAYGAALEYRPRYMVGYVSSIERFCEYLLAHSLRLPGLRAAISAAEPVTDQARTLLKQALGIPLFNTYGSREFMCIAAECDQHRGLHISTENLLVEQTAPVLGNAQTGIPSAIGAASDLLVTDLHNYGMPFLRYEIGDAGVISTGNSCACGRGLPMLERVEGRTTEILRLANGRILSALVFPHAMKDVPEVREFLIVQRSVEHFDLLVVLRQPLSEASRSLLRRYFSDLLGNEVTVKVVPVEEIPRSASGKRRIAVGLGRE